MKTESKRKLWFKRYKWYLERSDEYIDFFELIRKFYKLHKKDFPNFEDEKVIMTINSNYENYITKNGKVIRSIHPPDIIIFLFIIRVG